MNESQNSWPDYLVQIAGTRSGIEIAKATGISASTISRWLTGQTKPSSTHTAAVARTYDVPLAEVLEVVAAYRPPNVRESQMVGKAGRMSLPDEFGLSDREAAIREFTDLELAREIVRRIEEGEAAMLSRPLDAGIDMPTNVSSLRQHAQPQADDELGDPESIAKRAAVSDEQMDTDEDGGA